MKKILIIVFLIASLCSYSQDKKINLKEIITTYSSALNLNTKDAKKLTTIIESYKNKLYTEDLDPKEFNTTVKLQTLEIHKLLTKEQFNVYKKLVAKHQPELNYKFN